MTFMVLEEYIQALGVSGCEKDIRKLILKRISGIADTRIDKLGSVIANKKGGGKKVIVAAHMDEVGFIVTHIKEDGKIKFAPVGGIDRRILISKRVVFVKNRITGVIGSKPVHLQRGKEIDSPVDISDLFIDIGAGTREEALKYVMQGDYAAFESGYVDMGRYIKSRALDDRVGCSLITELLMDDYCLNLYGVFTVQEEVGLRGAGAAAFGIEPEVAIVLEGTTCADTAEDEKDYITTPGSGPAISVADMASSANGRLLERIIRIAGENNIPFQFRRGTMGGNDAGRIHRAGSGCITATISVPTRYIHSPVSMINKEDYRNTKKLVGLLLKNLSEEEL
jgi:Cellulase M and related proteins